MGEATVSLPVCPEPAMSQEMIDRIVGEVGLRLLRYERGGGTLTVERVTTILLNVFDQTEEKPPPTTYPEISCHICGRSGGHHKWDCSA